MDCRPKKKKILGSFSVNFHNDTLRWQGNEYDLSNPHLCVPDLFHLMTNISPHHLHYIISSLSSLFRLQSNIMSFSEHHSNRFSLCHYASFLVYLLLKFPLPNSGKLEWRDKNHPDSESPPAGFLKQVKKKLDLNSALSSSSEDSTEHFELPVKLITEIMISESLVKSLKFEPIFGQFRNHPKRKKNAMKLGAQNINDEGSRNRKNLHCSRRQIRSWGAKERRRKGGEFRQTVHSNFRINVWE